MPVNDATRRDLYTLALRRMVRAVGLFGTILIVGLGFAIREGVINNHYYQSDLILILLSLTGILTGTWHYFMDVRTPNDTTSRKIIIAIYHAIGITFLFFVSGFDSPVVLCWLILLFATDIYFGSKAFWMSMMVLLVGWLIHTSIYHEFGTQSAAHGLSTIAILVVVGFMLTRVRLINDHERQAFYRIKHREEVQQDRLLTVINSIGDACISTNKDGDIQMYNAAALNLLDTNQSLKGRQINDVLHLFDKNKKAVNILKILNRGETMTVRTDLVHQFSDGEAISLYVNMAPIRPGFQQKAGGGYIFVIRDITKEKSLEEERDEFISVVSHELRTPVAVTEGNLSNIKFILERGGDSKPLKGAVDSAHEQIIYLAKMINDLSTLSRAERGVADATEDIDVRELMTTLYNEYLPQAKEKKLKLNLDLSPTLGIVAASRLYLEETLQNFITNAIKYTKEGTVVIGAHRKENQIDFSVKDSGIGMSKMDQRHIFEKFYRSEDYRTRETGGTGLGLYVVQKLTHKLKIKVEVESRLNHGSTFSFKLPVKD
jgi:PAS domain S-box-containing protein